MAKKVKPFADQFQDFVESLFDDGSIDRWEAEKRVKAQERRLKKLEREESAIKKTLEEIKALKTA